MDGGQEIQLHPFPKTFAHLVIIMSVL
ncbi:hypothetical protein CEXT_137831, partial [Caerostris extrusa]